MSTKAQVREIPRAIDDIQFSTDFGQTPAQVLAERQGRLGDTFWHGPDALFLGHPADVQAILRQPGQSERNPLTDLDPFGHPLSGYDQTTPASEQSRRVIATALHPRIVTTALDSIDSALRGQLRALAGTEFNPLDALPKVCARAALPVYLHGPAPNLVTSSVKAAQSLLDYLEHDGASPRWLPNLRLRRAQLARQRLGEECQRVARQACAEAPAECPRTVLDHLRDNGSGRRKNFSATVLSAVAPMTSLMLASALAWLFYELVQHREDVALIRTEALARPSRLDGQDLPAVLPHTYRFVQEVLRLRPPMWLVSRPLGQGARLGDFQLTADQRVAFSPYLLQRDARWWPQPDVFAPERWLASHSPRAADAYLPFGTCRFSERLCTSLLVLAAAQLCTEYRLELRHASVVYPRFGKLLRPARLRVRLDLQP